jgi:hypothetical protein
MKVLSVCSVFICISISCGSAQICGNNEEIAECGNICELNCKNYGMPPKIDPVKNSNICEEGCACKVGYIRNRYGKCVEDFSGFCCGKSSTNINK